jgi:hypothetical protein
MLWKDPSVETENLLAALDGMSDWTPGQFASWIYRVKILNSVQEKRKIFAAMARRLTKDGMKKFREMYYALPTPDRRVRE